MILQILTLILASATARKKLCIRSRDCRLICLENLSKCVANVACTSDFDCAELGEAFTCAETTNDGYWSVKSCTLMQTTCHPFNYRGGCDKYFQCENGECIAQVWDCYENIDCNVLQLCNDGYCKMRVKQKFKNLMHRFE